MEFRILILTLFIGCIAVQVIAAPQKKQKVIEEPEDYANDENEDDYESEEDIGYVEDKNYLPPVAESPGGTVHSVPGQTVRMPCVIQNSELYVTIWRHNGNPLSAGETLLHRDARYKLNSKTLELSIENIQPEDFGSYVCSVKDKSGEDVSVHYSLLIDGPPKVVRVIPDHASAQVNEGDELLIMCEVAGYPKPDIFWSKKGENITAATLRQYNGEFREYSIYFPKASRHQDGNYLCMVDNGIGRDYGVARVQIRHKPEIHVPQHVHHSEAGYAVKLVCEVFAVPAAKTWQFIRLKDHVQEPVTNGSGRLVTMTPRQDGRGHRLELRLDDVQDSDFGSYACLAHNQLGKTVGRHIILTRRPAAEWLGDVIVDESGNADVSWKVHSIAPLVHMRFASLPQGVKIEKELFQELEIAEPHNNIYMFTQHLKHLKQGDYRVVAEPENSHGTAHAIDMKFTVHGPEEAPEPENISGLKTGGSSQTTVCLLHVIAALFLGLTLQ